MGQNEYMPVLDDKEFLTEDEESFSVGAILQALWLRRRVFIAVVFFSVATASIYINQLVPRYSSESVILIGAPKSRVVDVEAVLSGNLERWDAIGSEVEILKSRGIAKKVIEKLNLLDVEEFNPSLRRETPGLFYYLNPLNWISEEFKKDVKEAVGADAVEAPGLTEDEKQAQLLNDAVNIYVSKLTPKPVQRSSIVKVSFESLDPKLAAKIANAHAEIYIVNQLEAKFEATQKATSWLNDQLADLRQKVESSEKAVEMYRSEHGLAKVSGGSGILDEQLSEINSQVIIAKAERAQAEARLRQVNRLLKSGSDLETASEILTSPMIQSLKTQEIALNRKVSEMSVEYGAKHPKMIRIKAEIKELKDKIRIEIKKIVAALNNEVEAARSREYSLRSSLKSLQGQTGESGKEEVQLRALEREANANRALFEQFLNRFKETTSTQGMQEADARIISEAEVPVQPSYPKAGRMYVITAILAVLAGFGVVFLLEKLNPGLRTPEQIEEILGVPAIGLIPCVDCNDPFEYVLEKPHSGFAEALNTLRVSLALSDPDKEVKAIQITSSVPEEGKSTLALCMARGVANSGKKILLVDGDLRRPSLEKKLGISEKTKGLTDLVMSHDDNISNYCFKDKNTELYIMPKGGAEYVSPTDIFTSQRMESVVAAMKREFDLVIFDTPPVMAVSDARALAARVDKTVFTVRWDHTPRNVVKAAIQQMINAEPNLAGVVLQRVNLKQYGSYGYGDSGYYYHYGKYGQYYSS
ncbi:MAG: GumC family protein [Gammaproteobacteria bacterium]